jgi:CRISPR-associated endonuclease/helicase Cas3
MGLYYAHSGKNKDNRSDWQLLQDHLREVARRSKEFAQEARREDTAFADAAWTAGLLHDLGKYRHEFQQMLRGLNPPREKTFHKQAGAAKAAEAQNSPVAFAIAGHHGGIPNKEDLRGQIAGPSGHAVAVEIWEKAVRDCPELSTLLFRPPQLKDSFSADVLTRLLFSCLVDADWIDTGEHERRITGLPIERPAPALEPATRLECVLAHIRNLASACKEPYIAELRTEILNDCIAATDRPPGLFSLTVPTGGGKTLSGLAFALKHAATHGLRRIIYVAPYLTILEQNAQAIRTALQVDDDDPAVFEHHSLAEPPGDETENETKREAAVRRAENWDAPVIITTNVQFFESLFSNKPGRCRKLHNIARSVIVLDECQTLPPELVAPTCSMLGQLATMLGCTLVLCTATQPAFDHTDLPEPLRNLHEIIPPTRNLFSRLRRVHLC